MSIELLYLIIIGVIYERFFTFLTVRVVVPLVAVIVLVAARNTVRSIITTIVTTILFFVHSSGHYLYLCLCFLLFM